MIFEPLADGSHRYITMDGDMVDLIAFRFYGDHVDKTALVLDANPGLADRGVVLSAGVEILLPPAPAGQRNTVGQVELWF